MNDVRAAAGAVSFALKTVRLADAVKKVAVTAVIAVCGYVVYRAFHEQ